MSYQRGDRVRIVVGPLGLTKDIHATRFVEESVVAEGDVAIYDAPHPKAETDTDFEDWHVVMVGTLFCPVHDCMIEPAS